MSKSIEQLILTLEKEFEVYSEVLELSKDKRRNIIEGHVKELDGITKKEQKMIVTLGKLEEIREAIISNIIKELEIEEIENIEELSKYLDDTAKNRIKDIKDKLITLLDEVKRENDLNSKLIQQSLDFIEFNKNLLISIENSSSTYSPNADEKNIKTKSNLFDARI